MIIFKIFIRNLNIYDILCVYSLPSPTPPRSSLPTQLYFLSLSKTKVKRKSKQTKRKSVIENKTKSAHTQKIHGMYFVLTPGPGVWLADPVPWSVILFWFCQLSTS